MSLFIKAIRSTSAMDTEFPNIDPLKLSQSKPRVCDKRQALQQNAIRSGFRASAEGDRTIDDGGVRAVDCYIYREMNRVFESYTRRSEARRLANGGVSLIKVSVNRESGSAGMNYEMEEGEIVVDGEIDVSLESGEVFIGRNLEEDFDQTERVHDKGKELVISDGEEDVKIEENGFLEKSAEIQTEGELVDEYQFAIEKNFMIVNSDSESSSFEHTRSVTNRLVDSYSEGFLSDGDFGGDGENEMIDSDTDLSGFEDDEDSDIMPELKERRISIKAVPMSLVLEDSNSKSYLCNTIDAPGHVNFSDAMATALRLADGAYLLDVKNGELLKYNNMVLPSGLSGDLSFVPDDTTVAMDSSGTSLVTIQFQDGVISFHQTHISQLIQDFTGQPIIFVIFIKVINRGNLKVVAELGHATAASDAFPLPKGQNAFALVQHRDGKIMLTVKLGNYDWNNLVEETIHIDNQREKVHKVFLNTYVRMDRSNGFKVLIVMEDHSLVLLQQGEIVWSREDGLASILDVKAAELPVEKDGVSVAKVESDLFEWLKEHWLKLKGTLMIATPVDMVAIQKMRLQSSEKSKMTRGRKGFRKLLIVLTRAGIFFALHTGDGRIV